MSKENTWSVVLLMFVHLLCPVLCGFDKVCTYEIYQRGVHAQGACGDSLSDILALVCSKSKRSARVRQDKHTGMPKYNATMPERLFPSKRISQLANIKLQNPVLNNKLSAWKFVIKKFFSNKERALAFLVGDSAAANGQKRGVKLPPVKRSGDMNIVCECCYHSCELEEFQDYCE
ncbi:molluscan insulin-related peptide 5-like [Ostrea edulis]|uniref:molluscan insulin-related peptide 5-like n=1 Tax=Ostrea edulis TaxID=37623 RepID=UPI00209471A6|nr:molluscan insulin-related peptide 5-like [Ostrea edulis]